MFVEKKEKKKIYFCSKKKLIFISNWVSFSQKILFLNLPYFDLLMKFSTHINQ